eukprot:m.291290 g.291290  ORF g.291290 m.291290 type:complete len:387 (-) comp12451_c0_seq1:162-1322(-)
MLAAVMEFFGVVQASDIFTNPFVKLFLALVPIASAVSAVLRNSKTIGALAQLGSLQRRFESESQLARRSEADVRETLKLRDKLTFTLGVIDVWMTPYLFGVAPTYFYRLYTPKVIILTVIRWLEFRKVDKHYLLYDFCYWVNFLALFYIWFEPHNYRLFQVLFMCATGPLAWSMLAFSHSLIFHSHQHMISVVIHISPMILAHGLRFHPSDQFTVCPRGPPGGDTDWQNCYVSPWELVGISLKWFYLWWLVLYYVWVFVILGNRIQQRGLQTLYDRVTSNSPIAPFLRSLNTSHLVKKAIYLLVHLAFATGTLFLSVIHWYSRLAHLAFGAVMLSLTAWNASHFYFNVFSKNYEQNLVQRLRQRSDSGASDTASSSKASKEESKDK